MEERLTVKYGPEIISDFQELFNNENTLTAIAGKYKVSRERARQWFEELYSFAFTEIKVKRSRSRKLKAAKEKRNLVLRELRYKKDSLVYKGVKSELLVQNICRSFGYQVEANGHGNTVDLIINGYPVDVKASYKSKKTNAHGPKYFHFGSRKKQRQMIDFYVCHVVPTNEFYVIPSSIINCDSIFIREGQSKCRNAGDNYNKYKSAWHLLEKAQAEAI
jgi:hypothetical protein